MCLVLTLIVERAVYPHYEGKNLPLILHDVVEMKTVPISMSLMPMKEGSSPSSKFDISPQMKAGMR